MTFTKNELEIIDWLQEERNARAYAILTALFPDERSVLDKVGINNCETFHRDGWIPAAGIFVYSQTYRIKPDFVPGFEGPVEYPVVIDPDTEQLRINTPSCLMTFRYAMSKPDFLGFYWNRDVESSVENIARRFMKGHYVVARFGKEDA